MRTLTARFLSRRQIASYCRRPCSKCYAEHADGSVRQRTSYSHLLADQRSEADFTIANTAFLSDFGSFGQAVMTLAKSLSTRLSVALM